MPSARASPARLQEAGASLPRASLHEQPLPAKTVVIGEVGLAGELRPVPNVERRLQEAARLGYKRAIVPRGEINPVDGMQVRQVATLGEALAAVQP